MEKKPWEFGIDDASLLLNGMTTAYLVLGWEDGDEVALDLTKRQFEMILQILGLQTRGSDWTSGQRHRLFAAYTDQILGRIDYFLGESKVISHSVRMTDEELREFYRKGADPDDLI